MSNLTLDYTGEQVPTQGLVTSPIQAASQIQAGYLPANLIDLHVNEFRDATLGYILRDTTNHDTVLGVLCAAMRSVQDLNVSKIYGEYLTACSYSWGRNDLALKAITHNAPENTTKFVWAVAQAMAKQMPGPFYQTLLVSQLHQAENAWQEMYPTS
jgi:hypothetical protein